MNLIRKHKVFKSKCNLIFDLHELQNTFQYNYNTMGCWRIKYIISSINHNVNSTLNLLDVGKFSFMKTNTHDM